MIIRINGQFVRALVLSLSALTTAHAALAAGDLRICVDENAPPVSARAGGKASGFDLELAAAIAKRLDKTLSIRWFENNLDEDASLSLQANALLSEGVCDLVSSYPMITRALQKPGVAAARLPHFDGWKPADRRRPVPLGILAPSKPYYYSALTVVSGGAAASRTITGLGDLQGVKLGVLETTLADAALMTYGNRKYANQITHVEPGPRGRLLERLEQGEYEATLVSYRMFDAYRLAHSDTKLKGSDFIYKFGFNMGFVGLDKSQALIDAVNGALTEMQAKGEIAELARAAGLTYIAPKQPDVAMDVTFFDIMKD
jgi:ABC-type amino acid transport substrate-binding protein